MKKKFIFTQIEKEEFLKEFDLFSKDFKEEYEKKREIHLYLNLNLSKNIEIFFEKVISRKFGKIVFVKSEDIDLVGMIIFAKYISLNYNFLEQKIGIKFLGFKNEELYQILGENNYLDYIKKKYKRKVKYKENIQKIWLKDKFEYEKKKLNNQKVNFKEILEYEILKKEFEIFPFSHFNFTLEKDEKRLIYYQKNFCLSSILDFKKIVKKLNLKEKRQIIKILNSLRSYNNKMVDIFGLSFTYNLINKKTRTTFYTSFDKLSLKKEVNKFVYEEYDFDKRFFEEISKFNFTISAVDFYEDYCEFKFYNYSNLFREKLENQEVLKILEKKPCATVKKILRNSEIISKYEFNLREDFNSKELEILKKNDLFKENCKVLAIYIKDKEIIKKTLYEV